MGDPHSIATQSANPVAAVGPATTSPPISANQAAGPSFPSATPAFPITDSAVAKTSMPIVASVRGGCDGCPGKPWISFTRSLYQLTSFRIEKVQHDLARGVIRETVAGLAADRGNVRAEC